MKFSRIISLFLCLAFVMSMSLIVGAEVNEETERPEYSKGDINGDGEVTAKDYLLVKRIFLGTYSAESVQLFAADVNDNRSVDSVDYLMIKRHFLGTYNIEPNTLKEQIPLTDEQIQTIKEDYVEYWREKHGEDHMVTVEEITINKYYGPYSNCYALFISHPEMLYLQELVTKFIAGYEFLFWDGQTLMVYKDSSFVDLETAYKNGMLTKDDVSDLSWYFAPNRSSKY